MSSWRLCEVEKHDVRRVADGGIVAGKGEAAALVVHAEHGDVIRALEGPLVLSDGEERAEPSVVGVTEAVFRDLSVRVESCFDDVTLADICERARRMGLPRIEKETYSYVI